MQARHFVASQVVEPEGGYLTAPDFKDIEEIWNTTKLHLTVSRALFETMTFVKAIAEEPMTSESEASSSDHEEPEDDLDQYAFRERGDRGRMCVSAQVISSVLYCFEWEAGTSGGKTYKAGCKPLRSTPVSDCSGKTNTRISSNKVSLQISLVPLKLINSKGNVAPVILNLTIGRNELSRATSDHPMIYTSFADGRPLPLNAKMYVGGSPTPNHAKMRLSKRREASGRR